MSFVTTSTLFINIIENTTKKISFEASGGKGTYYFNILTLPQYGTLSDIKFNTVEYTPDNNYVGNDYFTYNATDGITASEESKVYINNLANNIDINVNIFETSIFTIIPPLPFIPAELTILDFKIGLVLPNTNNILLKNVGRTKIICNQNGTITYYNLNVFYYNKNSKSYNLLSPTLAAMINDKKYYKKQIAITNNLLNKPFNGKYNPNYYLTSYNRIKTPNVVQNPY
jgi:hypothetical protein